MSHLYILVGQTPVPCDNVLEWAQWFETAERRVRLTRVGPYFVSTVFLGLDYRFPFGGPPIFFETKVWIETGAEDPLEARSFLDLGSRCATWLEAEQQHEKAVREIGETHDDVEQLYPEVLEKVIP